jgi:prepilin-type N-terminal cleavage/methylation domain-containing protein
MNSEHDSGFTLIETLIAFVILSLALVMWTQTVALATKSVNRAREDHLILNTLSCLDQNTRTIQEKWTQHACFEKGNHWDARQFQVPGASKELRFTVIQIAGPSGRKTEFLRFNPPEPGASK